MDIYQFASMQSKDIEQILKTSLNKGLTSKEAKIRLAKNGENKINKSKNLILEILLRQLQSPLIYLLLFASLTSYLLKNKVDAIVILSIVLVNTLIGFIQEYNAQRTLDFLEKQFKHEIIVMRDNEQYFVETKNIVPGDIIYLKTGDYIPADIRLIATHNLILDESSLTGESKSILKNDKVSDKKPKTIYDSDNLVFFGTSVLSGNGIGVVINTGKQTIYGNINIITEKAFHESKFQQDISKLSKFLLYLVLITITFVFTLNFFLKPNVDTVSLILFCIAIAVGIIPEALPLVTNFAMTNGALQLAKHKVLVKRLSAIEDLGSINVLCTDKTGTLTENKLVVKNLYSYNNEDIEFYGYLSVALLKITDPIDISLNELKKTNLSNYSLISEFPFEHKKLSSSVLLKSDSQYLYILKGVAEIVIKDCKEIPQVELEKIKKFISVEGLQGKRTIAIAYKNLNKIPHNIEEETNLTLAGIISFEDPIKPDIEETINKSRKLGIRFIMLTGDSKEVAFAVANKLEMVKDLSDVMTGLEFKNLKLHDQIKIIDKCNVFARVTPEVKYDIINILKKDKFVGFLADGINDAPALKASHVGIVVSQASAIAKEAADIVILKKSLTVIVNGIIQGRKTFANTIKYIKISITSNLGNFYSVALISLLIDFLPLLPLQIILVNILSDLPMIALANDTVALTDLKRPSNYNIKDIALSCSFFGIISSLFDFLTFGIFLSKGPQVLQTNWFIETLLTELVIIFALRTHLPFYKAPRPSKLLFFITFICGFIAIYLPFTDFGKNIFKFVTPSVNNILIVFILVFSYFVVTEFTKKLYYGYLNNTNTR